MISLKIFYPSLATSFALGLALFPSWQSIFNDRAIPALLATLLSWIWMTVLSTGAIHIWRGKFDRPIYSIVYIIFLSIALSGFWLLVFYPGVMSSDALAQWQQALNNRYYTWHPPILAMLMNITQKFTRDTSLITFIQGFFFWSSIFYLLRQLIRDNKIFLFASSFMAFLPTIWLYSNALTSNSWMAIFFFFSLSFFLQALRTSRKIYWYLSILSLSLAIVFRRDAVVFLIALLPFFLFFLGKNKSLSDRVKIAILIVVLCVLPARIIDLGPNIIDEELNPSAHGVMNRYVGTIVHAMPSMTPEEITAERESIDGEFGAGTFDRLNREYLCHFSDYISLSANRVIDKIDRERNSFIRGKVIEASLQHPVAFLQHQNCFAKELTQVKNIYHEGFWGLLGRPTDKPNPLRERLGIEFNSKLPGLKERYGDLLTFLRRGRRSLLFRHYIFLIFLFLFAVLGWAIRSLELILLTLPNLLYFVLLWLLGPAVHWRYLLTPYLSAWICFLFTVNYSIQYRETIARSGSTLLDRLRKRGKIPGA